jgi:hypothetical protein
MGNPDCIGTLWWYRDGLQDLAKNVGDAVVSVSGAGFGRSWYFRDSGRSAEGGKSVVGLAICWD